MRPKITDKEWDKIIQDAFSAGAPDPHFSGAYCAKRRDMEEQLAMKEDRKHRFQPGLVLATVGALLIAAVPAGMIVMMQRTAEQPELDPRTAVTEESKETEIEDVTALPADAVTVPDLTGYRYEYASKILEQMGMQVEIKYDRNAEISAGSVFEMYPKAGEIYEQDSIVVLYVSTGVLNDEMPDVNGLKYEQAKELLEIYELNVEPEYVTSDQPAKTVIAQSIPAGTTLKSGTTVTLTVAVPNDMVTVPDLKDIECEEAQEILAEEGFRFDVEYSQSTDVEQNHVIRTEPSAGAVIPYGSEVTLYVATPEIPMPSCLGLNMQEALRILKDNAIVTFCVEEPSDELPGTVIAQSIAPGTMVKNGDTVTLTIAIADESE
ncbi:MAG: PASTA domain-containing protein [Oscillospiraceae bacterium]|nr:PASTA domain-containing protein [Oscillospiraceae bacterium]